MYTERNAREDIYKICQSYYVRYELLSDFIFDNISLQDFTSELSLRKDEDEIDLVLKDVDIIKKKIQQNGGKLEEHPIDIAKRLRKEGKQQEAFKIIVPYMRENDNDEFAKVTFGWIMYDCFKATEEQLDKYIRNLSILNNHVSFDFTVKHNEQVTLLLSSILWSIRRVAMQDDLHTNKIFGEFKRFVGHSSAYIYQNIWGTYTTPNTLNPSKLLTERLLKKLDNKNYMSLINMIGFDWFEQADYKSTQFKDNNGKMQKINPLVETTLNKYAKGLVQEENHNSLLEEINRFLPILENMIKQHEDFIWLPYYRIRLLMKIGKNEEALSETTKFARNKSDVFWVWNLISDLVEGNEKFNCLCAGLLCKTNADLITGMQEKSIPYLIQEKMYGEAKYILNRLINTRINKKWSISPELTDMKNCEWFTTTKEATNLNRLKKYAEEANKILYRTLPITDAFITHINHDKGFISFIFYKDGLIKEGFFKKDDIGNNFEWNLNSAIRIQMWAEKSNSNLYHVFSVANGDEECKKQFLHDFSGTFDAIKEFGFIRDSMVPLYVDSARVKEYNLIPYCKVYGTMVKKWDNKKDNWGWQIVSIDQVEEPDISDYEKEVSGFADITGYGYGFVEDCFISKDIIKTYEIQDYDSIEAKVQKCWDKSKEEWSWKVIEIISVSHDFDFE